MHSRPRPAVLASFAAFVLVGITSGVSGVLLPTQMASYRVDQATIGLMFFAGAGGFALAGLSTGAVLHQLGTRVTLATAAGIYTLAGLSLAMHPPFEAFLAAQLLGGFALGILESVLNVYLAGLPNSTTLLNRLHAFWGAGALLGPPLATWLLGFASWTGVYLVLALAFLPIAAIFLLVHPRSAGGTGVPRGARPVIENSNNKKRPPIRPETQPASLLRSAMREPGILMGSVMLTVYVGLELGVGNWAFSYLTRARDLPGPTAGYVVSAYWAGLTLGRFVITPVAARLRVPVGRVVYGCLIGIVLATAVAWLSPTPVACVALGLLGFCLGPVFPTTMSIAPRLTEEPLVPTAIGVMNSASTVGGSLLPWLMGVLTQAAGMHALLPFALVLAIAQFAAWRPVATRTTQSANPAAANA